MNNLIDFGTDLDVLSVAKTVKCDIEDIKTHIGNSNHKLNILSQNIRSINCNISSFIALLHRSQIAWDILVLTECWLPTSKSIPPLEDYDYSTTCNHKTQNEGVVIYYKKKFKVFVEEPEVSGANCLIVKFNTDTCILGMYRPPSQHNTDNFINSVDTLIGTLNCYKNVILCGDINIDICPNSPDKRQHDYLNLMATYSMLPGHTLPTHGRTCLDHIMIRSKDEATCLVIESSITDHECVALCLNHSARLSYNNSYKRINFERLDMIITGIDFQPILDCTDVDIATDSLISQLSLAINNSTELTRIPKRQHISKPWITKGLLRCMKNRDNLYKKLKRDCRNEILKTTYKRYRNYCNLLLKKAKIKYEREEIDNAKENKKQLWDTIKKFSGCNKTKDHSMTLLDRNEPVKSINQINSFFANVGRNLAEEIVHSQHYNTPLPRDTSCFTPNSSMVMLPTDELEVKRVVRGLKNGCAVGNDLISGKLLKRYLDILTPSITHICNLAISTGIFPRAFKIALVKPIHKGGKPDCVNNYRPISILPALSKILERLMNQRLTTFLEDNNLLSPNQFGFRHRRSTSDAVHELVHSIATTLDNKGKCVTMFLDLAKAFDSVSIPHLLIKLETLGVRGLPLKLFENYLKDRRQRVKIDQIISNESDISFGVPQGSIIGPTLFLVYINDLCNLQLDNAKILTFADDTAIFFGGTSWEQVFESAQKGFDKVSQWLHRNVLTLNTSKTKYIAFALRSNLLPIPTLNIIAHNCSPGLIPCTCKSLQRTDQIKYLGVIIDQTLSFRPHIEVLVSRLRKLIHVFRNLRHIADQRLIKMVYHTLCQSLLEYCITSWGGACKSYLIEAERAQRAILKVALGRPYRYPTVKLYTEWDVLTVRKIFLLQTVLKKHSQLYYDPDTLSNKRRKGTVCSVQKFRTSFAQRFFCFLGNYLYNKMNSKLNIYELHRTKCKYTLTNYLKSLHYDQVENMLCSVK